MYFKLRIVCFLSCIIPLLVACSGSVWDTNMASDGPLKTKFIAGGENFNLLTFLIPAVRAEEVGLFEQQKLTSHLLINLFLEKLKQEKLLIFGREVSKSDLQPHQVLYVHNINDNSMQARLSFKLKGINLVPDFDEYYIDSIIVEMDKEGNIMGVNTQVSPLPRKDSE